MAWRYDAVICGVSATWEWAETGKTPSDIQTITENHSFQTRQDWKYRAIYGEWVRDGSLVFEQTINGLNYYGNFVSTKNPPTPVGGSFEGETQSTYGSASADYRGQKELGKQPIYGWVMVSSVSHGHPATIYFDDGVVAGYLTLDRCEGSASSPSGSGSYVGQQTDSSDLGTAYYSGDVPAKGGGGDPDPNPTFQVVAKNINDTSVRAVIEGLMFNANYYHLFEMELWRGNESEYLLTAQWTDSSNLKYTSYDFSGLLKGTTYTLKGFVKSTPTGGRTHVGTVVFSTTGTATGRPQNWAWTSLVSSRNTDPNRTYYGGVIPLAIVSETEWNNFCKRINEFRKYKNLEPVTFTTAVSNGDFTSTTYDQAKNAIGAMTTVSQPSGFYSKLVVLKEALNSIN